MHDPVDDGRRKGERRLPEELSDLIGRKVPEEDFLSDVERRDRFVRDELRRLRHPGKHEGQSSERGNVFSGEVETSDVGEDRVGERPAGKSVYFVKDQDQPTVPGVENSHERALEDARWIAMPGVPQLGDSHGDFLAREQVGMGRCRKLQQSAVEGGGRFRPQGEIGVDEAQLVAA